MSRQDSSMHVCQCCRQVGEMLSIWAQVILAEDGMKLGVRCTSIIERCR